MNPDDLEALKANVQKLIDADATDEDIHAYIEAAHHEKGVTPRRQVTPEPVPPPGPGERMAAHVLNAAQGIPGMEAVEAGMGVLGSHIAGKPLSYEQSLGALRGATEEINPWVSAGEKALGAALTLPWLPANPAAAGAILGGADQLASATPQSLLSRGVKTGLGVAGGGLLGKAADMAVTGSRSLLMSSPARNLLERGAERAASAKQLYGAALAEGKGAAATPEIQAYLAEPDIAEIVGELKNTRQFAAVSPDSPEMLDAVYKTLSDRATTARKGLLAVTPNKPNIGRFQAKDIAAAQQSGLKAMDTTMPTYREAVKDYAQHKAAEDAVARGYEAVRSGLLGNLPSAKNLTRTTPQAFEKWIAMAGPDESKAAVEGILGAVNAAVRKAPLTMGRRATWIAPSLLRAAGDATARYLPRMGLLGVRGAY